MKNLLLKTLNPVIPAYRETKMVADIIITTYRPIVRPRNYKFILLLCIILYYKFNLNIAYYNMQYFYLFEHKQFSHSLSLLMEFLHLFGARITFAFV